jgi:hypothetical protein
MAQEVGYFENLTEMPKGGPFVVCRLLNGRHAVEVAPERGAGCPTVPAIYVANTLEAHGLGRGNYRESHDAHRAADWLNDQLAAADLDESRIRQR